MSDETTNSNQTAAPVVHGVVMAVEKTAKRCISIAIKEKNSWTDAEKRAALKIKKEFGIEDGAPCPACYSSDTVKIDEDYDYVCLRCKQEWSLS